MQGGRSGALCCAARCQQYSAQQRNTKALIHKRMCLQLPVCSERLESMTRMDQQQHSQRPSHRPAQQLTAAEAFSASVSLIHGLLSGQALMTFFFRSTLLRSTLTASGRFSDSSARLVMGLPICVVEWTEVHVGQHECRDVDRQRAVPSNDHPSSVHLARPSSTAVRMAQQHRYNASPLPLPHTLHLPGKRYQRMLQLRKPCNLGTSKQPSKQPPCTAPCRLRFTPFSSSGCLSSPPLSPS